MRYVAPGLYPAIVGSTPTLRIYKERKEEEMRLKQRRKKFNIIKAKTELKELMPDLPENYVYKFISNGGFSAISFVMLVAEATKINNLYVSSFRIGKKELQIIDTLHKKGIIENCCFAVGTLMKNDSEAIKKYGYYENFEKVCKDNGFRYCTVNNHSKIILFDTDVGKYILETSSNLNTNPKIEQFSFEKDDELFDFYKKCFESWSCESG